MKIIVVGLIIVLILSLLSCANDTPTDVADGIQTVQQTNNQSPEAISYSRTVQPLLDRYCVRCHNESSAVGGIDLSSYDKTMVIVIPGNVCKSLLYNSLVGNGVARQPPGSSLSAESIQLIGNWIIQGASNN